MKKIFHVFMFVVVGILLCNSNIYAQTKLVFQDSTYVNNLRKLYEDLPLSKKIEKNIKGRNKEISYEEVTAFLVDFESFWDANKITEEQKKDIVKLTNYFILKMRLNKKYEVYTFLKLITILPAKSKENFRIWLLKLENMSKSKRTTKKSLKTIINRTFILIKNGYIYKSKICRWKVSSKNFKLILGSNDKFEIEIPQTDLTGEYTLKDTALSSILIKQTEGKYDPLTNKWTGKKGTVTWEKYSYGKNKVFANLNNYSIFLKIAKYKADSVMFSYKELSDKNILGSLTDQASVWAKNNPVFPEFVSYKNNYTIKAFIKNIQLKGGVIMKGGKLYTGGTESNPAIVKILHKGRVFIRIESYSIAQKNDTLISERTKVAIYNTKSDSITHSDVKLEMQGGVLTLTRNYKSAGMIPFQNSYHKLDMFVDQIVWDSKQNKLKFYSESSEKGYFRSVDYFTKRGFELIRMHDDQNPLFLIKHYVRVINKDNKDPKTWVRQFYARDFSNYIRKDPIPVKQRLMGLWHQGFLDYNSETQLVTVKQKLYDYINFFLGKKDYDAISMQSSGNKDPKKRGLYKTLNGEYDLISNDLYVKGVKKTVLSLPKKVGFMPKGDIKIKKNRDMEFDGELKAGFATFRGDGFKFNYDNFDIHFEDIDSVNYSVITKLDKDFLQVADVLSTVDGVSGKIRIDSSTNKSSVKIYRQYPIFTCTNDSYVYYDKKNSQGNAYNREDFYFRCYPYELDSLSLLFYTSLTLKGYMKAGGIFPDFEDTLTMQMNQSLGFTHKLKEGESLYGGIGKFTSGESKSTTVTLSNEGLSGAGNVEWRTVIISSDNFTFLPDRVETMAKSITMAKNNGKFGDAEYPDVQGSDVDVVWNTKEEYVKCKTLEKPLSFYDKKLKMEGDVTYDVKKITGNGKISLKEGVIKSKKEFNFNESSLYSELTDMELKDIDDNKPIMEAFDMRTFVDINAEKSVFQSNSDSAKISFTKNDYDNYSDHFVWYQGKNKAEINYNMEKYTNPPREEAGKELNRSYLIDKYNFRRKMFSDNKDGCEFISVRQGQDSLKFKSEKALFDGKDNKIIVKKVEKIEVADIVVVPSSDVEINEGAKMNELLNTSVKARGKHNIADVDIKISGRNEYEASSGTYLYIDETEKSQNIYFSLLYYDSHKKASVAEGEIPISRKFTLSPDFDFYGDVRFNATNDYLEFHGYTKLVHSCDDNNPWFNFKSTIDPQKVQIPLKKNLKSKSGDMGEARIFADVMISPDSIHSFPAFLTYDPYGTSKSIYSLRDSMYYVYCDKSNNGIKYKIADKNKINNPSLSGNVMTYDTKNCIVTSIGDFDYARTLKFEFDAVGEYKHNLQTNSASLNTITYFDFPFPNKLQNMIIDKVKDLSAAEVDPASRSYQRNLKLLIGNKKGNKFIEQLSLRPDNPKFPDELKHTLLFSDLRMTWDQETSSFKSVGAIGIGSLKNKVLNKYLKGYVQVKRRLTSDYIYVYFEIDENTWYYFRFTNDQMYVDSPDKEFKDYINKLKDKDREDKKTGYKFILAPDHSDCDGFIEDFTGEKVVRVYENEDETEGEIDGETDEETKDGEEDTEDNEKKKEDEDSDDDIKYDDETK